MKILILEDEVIIAESLYQLLSLLDYDPMEPVDTPEDAIRLINNEQPQLAILDLRLQKGKNGLEVAAYIDSNKLNIPYIILTAHSDSTTVAAVKKYKPAAYLLKPFSRESLFVAIEMAVIPEDVHTDTPAEETDNSTGELFIKTGNKHEKINLTDVIAIRSQGKYTEMNMGDTKRLLRMSLSTFIESFKLVSWLRVHRAYAVNPAFVTAVSTDELELGKIKVPVGRFFYPDVSAYFIDRKPV